MSRGAVALRPKRWPDTFAYLRVTLSVYPEEGTVVEGCSRQTHVFTLDDWSDGEELEQSRVSSLNAHILIRRRFEIDRARTFMLRDTASLFNASESWLRTEQRKHGCLRH